MVPEIFSTIKRPTLLLDRSRAKRNIRQMVQKAADSGVRFRPHFKTHQSAAIGEWFRELGVKTITVSSVEMALYFARNHWTDITIAFPTNIREIDSLNELARELDLSLLLESTETAEALNEQLNSQVDIWLKVDTGYGRTGILWNDFSSMAEVAATVERSRALELRGLLAHAGHTYGAGSAEKVARTFAETAARLQAARSALEGPSHRLELSVGDTPGCSIVPLFEGVDEVRPGNFVFYDLSQYSFGACAEEDVAVAVACPIVAKHPSLEKIVVYGGAVHLSKESLLGEDGRVIFGGVALPAESGWSAMFKNSAVVSLSQEHGIVRAEKELLESVEVGDLLMILPVHSCLTANLLGRFSTLEGELLEMARF